jgi:dTDP-4-dehydrorhamnose 3,5-epimerase
MRMIETTVDGAKVIELERRTDDRGFFARVWDRDTFAAHGLTTDFPQCNSAFSRRRGTLRGLHYQAAPHSEAKLVRCTRGRVFDVVVDVRPQSPTYKKWFGVELSADEGRMLYVPAECAHGYLTLEDETEVTYPVSTPYEPASERGVRWDDPEFGIAWPIAGPFILSDKDRQWPNYR